MRVSWSTSPTHKSWPTEPPPSKYGLRYGHPHPPWSTPYSTAPTYAMLSGGFWIPLASCYQPPRELSRENWRRWEGWEGSHRLWSQPLSLPVPTPLPESAASFPLPVGKFCKVPAIEELVWHKHVTLRTPGVILVPLLQDQYCVPRVAVWKVNPELGPIWRPSRAPLYQAPEPQQTFRERHPVSLGLPGGEGGAPPWFPCPT